MADDPTTTAALEAEVERLRGLLRAVVGQVEGCHDCFRLSGDEDLQREVYEAVGRDPDAE